MESFFVSARALNDYVQSDNYREPYAIPVIDDESENTFFGELSYVFVAKNKGGDFFDRADRVGSFELCNTRKHEGKAKRAGQIDYVNHPCMSLVVYAQYNQRSNQRSEKAEEVEQKNFSPIRAGALFDFSGSVVDELVDRGIECGGKILKALNIRQRFI